MNRLLLSTAVLAMIATPTLAGAKTAHPRPAKHKVVKAKKVTTTSMTEAKAK